MGALLNRLLQEVSWQRKYCHNCISWRWDKNIELNDGTVYVGHCGLISAMCINAVADHSKAPPPRFIHMETPVND